MEYLEVDARHLAAAGRIHSESWQASHRELCSPEFVQRHTPEAQADYLRQEIAAGKRLFMLVDQEPVGIVSVQGHLIEHLYVRPARQRQGYGTRLLRFAMSQCDGEPVLWILNTNVAARRLYEAHGFEESGRRKRLNERLEAIELICRNGRKETAHLIR